MSSLFSRRACTLALSAAALVACQTEAPPSIPEIHLGASDFAFALPDTITGGLVTVELMNDGQEDHHAQFIRLNDGVTRAQFDSTFDAVMVAVATEGDVAFMRLFDVATVAGGPSIVAPGGHSVVTLELDAGEYVLFCFVPSPDGVPHIAKGMRRWVTVTQPSPDAEMPTLVADGTVDMADFAFASIPEIHAGPMVLEVTNSGQEPHEMAIIRLEGVDLAQLLPMFTQPPAPGETPSGPPPFTFVGGMQALMPGQRGWVTLDLTPGDYAMICLIPSPAREGQLHVALGMVRGFTVD